MQTQLMTVDQVAETLQIGVRSVWRLKDSGRMPAPVRLGKSVRWQKGLIDAWIGDGCPDVRKTRWSPFETGSSNAKQPTDSPDWAGRRPKHNA